MICNQTAIFQHTKYVLDEAFRRICVLSERAKKTFQLVATFLKAINTAILRDKKGTFGCLLLFKTSLGSSTSGIN